MSQILFELLTWFCSASCFLRAGPGFQDASISPDSSLPIPMLPEICCHKGRCNLSPSPLLRNWFSEHKLSLSFHVWCKGRDKLSHSQDTTLILGYFRPFGRKMPTKIVGKKCANYNCFFYLLMFFYTKIQNFIPALLLLKEKLMKATVDFLRWIP